MNTIFFSTIFSEIIFQGVSLSSIVSLFLSLGLLACSALVSASEVAFFSFSPQDLKELEESENKKDKNVLKILEKPQHLLATILIANNFVNIALILSITYFSGTLFEFRNPLVWFIFQTIVITFLLLLLGEIMPKIYATQNGKKTARATVVLLSVLQFFLSPFVNFLVKSTSLVNNRLEKHFRSNISIDELSQALELTSTKTDEDKEILEGIIKFGNIRVVDIMTSRMDVVAIEIKSNYKDLLKKCSETGYSRIPVISESRDNIRGVLYTKDLLAHLDKPNSFRWQTLIRQAYYIPETTKIDDLLNEFQKNRIHLAIVVDEYGGTAGIITLEDILEEIVGEISDEHDEQEELYTKINANTFLFEGKILLNDFYKIEEIKREDFVKITDEVETLAGLILELRGELPKRTEKIVYGRYEFEVIAVDNRRIKKIKLKINEQDAANEK